jgi:hypothetical protein
MSKSKWMVAVAVISMVLTFGLTSIAAAQVQANPGAPGSVIVFPKFSRGVTPTSSLARSVFEIGVVCPTDQVVPGGHGCNLPQNFPVKLALDWVCPGSVQKGAASFCQSVDFELHTTLYGKLQFDANGNVTAAPDSGDIGQGVITEPSCDNGYLIARVVDQFGRLISFNGLVGESLTRERANSSTAWNGYTIQALAATGAVIDPGNNAMVFNGTTYAALTGRFSGDVRYERSAAPTVQTSLILLSLDIRQNNFNPNIQIPVRLYRADESSTSSALHFTCWRQVRLTELDGGPFNQTRMGEKGLIVASREAFVAAACAATGAGCTPVGTPITALGWISTIERGGQSEYGYYLYNNGPLIPTTFFPLGF